MKKIALAIAAVTLMASCSKNQIKTDKEHQVPVRFSLDVGKSTKVSTFGPIDLTVLKASTDGFNVATSGLGSAEMSNLKVTFSSTWNYTGDYFWPINPTQNVTFSAYAPHSLTGVGTFSATSGLTLTNFTPGTLPTNQVDVLYAAPATFNRGGSGVAGVALTFNHLLTQIVFNVSTDIPAADTPTLGSIVLTVPTSKGNYSAGTWTTAANSMSWTVLSNTVVTAAGVASTPLLMIPQATLPAGTTAAITFTTLSGTPSTHTVDLSTQTVTSWQAGQKITYNISITNANMKVKFTDPTITNWVNVSNAITY